MLQKFHITLCAIIAGLFSVLFSPYTAVANDGKEPPCENIRLLNKASQEWCRSKGWGMDTKGRWVQMKGDGDNRASSSCYTKVDNATRIEFALAYLVSFKSPPLSSATLTSS